MDTKRPHRNDSATLKKAALAIFPKVVEWLKGNDDYFETDNDYLLEDIVNASFGETDAYQIAKNLDANGWSPDAELVDILDTIFTEQYHAREAAEKQWVKDNGLQAPNLQSKVTCKGHEPKVPSTAIGIVIQNFESGKSSVYFESLGHVKTGIGTNGTLLPWEDLTVVETKNEI